MAESEVYKSSMPPFSSPSSSAATFDSSDSSDDNSAAVVPRTRCKHPGRRLIGGRIYDSVLGVTCHWCRQKTVEDHVFCCHCTIAFCGGCLRNRHGEDIEVEMKDDVEWTCPKCRGGCGLGCKNCCNCGPCRKAQSLEPTGLLVHTARGHGFTNVHDYLIHQKTGESEEIIAKRKKGKGWCQTNPSSFHKKQKRVEDDTEVAARCRKRLSFTSRDISSPEKRCDNALHIKEINHVSCVSKDEKLHQVGILESKVDGHKEPKSNVLVPASVKAIIVQPKPEPDLLVHEDSRSRAASPSQGKATNVQPHVQRVLRSSSSPLQQPAQTNIRPHLHVEVEPAVCEGHSQQSVVVKKELCEPDLQPKHEASCNAFDILLKVQTEEVPLCHRTSCEPTFKDKHLQQVKQECLDQLVVIREESNAQLIQVKEEMGDQCSQPLCDNYSVNRPNLFAAAFSRDEGDAAAAWCREIPSENVEGPTSRSTSLNSETLRSACDAGNLSSPSTSNFHLYPINPMPVFSYFKKEVVDEQNIKTPDVAVKLKSMNNQGAQCSAGLCLPVTVKGSKDGVRCSQQSPISCSYHERTASTASAKEVQEDGWNVHCPAMATKSTLNVSHTSSLLGTVKVKAEREDFSFTIEPFQGPSAVKNGRLSVTQVKEEVIVDTPMSKVIGIDDDEAQAVSGKDKPASTLRLKQSSSLRAMSHFWKVDDFKSKLEAKLSEPFSSKELEILATAASHRKPIYKARETRQGCSQFVSEEEGYSYLDHHPDLALRLEESVSPVFRLSLLRGFFFWLEHASTQGAFKPWTSVSGSSEIPENEDCVEIDGPDCEILAVVCSIDEEAG